MATDWLEIGSEKMRMARRKQRLSVEEVAIRLRHNGYRITGRTYDRWEGRGEVPRPALQAVAAVLGFDSGAILADQPTRVQWQQAAELLAEVAGTMKVLVELLAEQREVVARLESVAAALQQREAANSPG